MSNAYLCMDTYTHITIHLYLNMLQSYWYKCTKSPPTHRHTDAETHRCRDTHTHLSSRQSLVSVVAADSWVTVLLLLLLHVFHTADTRHRSHTWHTHRRQACVCVCMHRRDKEQGSHNDREGDRERMFPLPSLLLMLRSHCCVNSDWLFGFNL